MALFSLFMTGLSVVGLSVFYVNIRKEELEIRRMNGAAPYQLIVEVIQHLSTFVFVGVLVALPLSYIFIKSWISQFVVTYPLVWWVLFSHWGWCCNYRVDNYLSAGSLFIWADGSLMFNCRFACNCLFCAGYESLKAC